MYNKSFLSNKWVYREKTNQENLDIKLSWFLLFLNIYFVKQRHFPKLPFNSTVCVMKCFSARWFLVKAHPSPGMSIKCIAEVKNSVSHEESCLCSKRKPWLKVCTIQNVGGWECACVHFEKLRNHCASQIDSIGDKTRQKRLECFFFLFIAVRGNSSFAFHDWNLQESVILFSSHRWNAHNSKPFKATGINTQS